MQHSVQPRRRGKLHTNYSKVHVLVTENSSACEQRKKMADQISIPPELWWARKFDILLHGNERIPALLVSIFPWGAVSWQTNKIFLNKNIRNLISDANQQTLYPAFQLNWASFYLSPRRTASAWISLFPATPGSLKFWSFCLFCLCAQKRFIFLLSSFFVPSKSHQRQEKKAFWRPCLEGDH